MGLWRCQNQTCSKDPYGRCIFDFEAPVPVCPECGIDGRQEPNVVIKLETVHLNPPHKKIKGVGAGVPACNPERANGLSGLRATGEHWNVNCPKCRDTEIFKTSYPEGAPGEVSLAAEIKLPGIAKPIIVSELSMTPNAAGMVQVDGDELNEAGCCG